MIGGRKNAPSLKRQRSLAASDPPSPTFSAVHASGKSTPTLKIRLPGPGTTTTTSSVSLRGSGHETTVSFERTIASDGKETPYNLPTRKPIRAEMKPAANEEARTYSPWSLLSWPLGKSTGVTKVVSENFATEDSPPTAPEATTTVPTPVNPDLHLQIDRSQSPVPPQNLVDGKIAPSGIGSATTPPPIVPSTPVADEASNQNKSDSVKSNIATDEEATKSTVPTDSSWFGWWWYSSQQKAKIPATADNSATCTHEGLPATQPSAAVVTLGAPLPAESSVSVPPDQPPNDEQNRALDKETNEAAHSGRLASLGRTSASSWLGWWASYKVDTIGAIPADHKPNSWKAGNETEIVPVPDQKSVASSSSAIAPIQPSLTLPSAEPQTTAHGQLFNSENTPARGSSWFFWYSAHGSTSAIGSPKDNSAQKPASEPAAVDTPSQSRIQGTKINKIPALELIRSPGDGSETSKPANNSGDEMGKKTKGTKNNQTMAAQEADPLIPVTSTDLPQSPAKQKLQKICSSNHIFPSLESCYQFLESPSILCQLTKIFKPSKHTVQKHLLITRNPPKIKRAVAIGVHGFFPMRIVRTVLGEPTGTSVRFAEAATSAIKRWAELNNVEVEVEKVALEGEGKVADRVEMLWKLLENWMDHVKRADFVLVAAHSQGVVVGIQLLAKMIEEGCVDKARVGFIAMAGINLGPFYHLPTSILTGSAKELFEFQKPESAVSKKYIQALRVVLAHHVRILYIGSIDDQLVPLESSTFSNIHHPYIFRAVFVDGRVHAPDFLSHLIGFALKLRNLGVSDHSLLRELSSPLAGSLYAGEGHSSIYNDNTVYDLGVRHALETTDCLDVPLRVDPFELPSSTSNPFLLPWAMRGLLEEPYVRSRLEAERKELLDKFEKWQPSSKPLKDVKFRLEGIRSIL